MARKKPGFYGPTGRLRNRPPSQASGLAPAPVGLGQGPTAQAGKKIKRKARNIGNALLPGNPFG